MGKHIDIADYVKNGIIYLPNWINNFLLHCNFLGGNVYFGVEKTRKKLNNLENEKQLLKIVNYAIKHVPYYRDKYRGLKISTVEEFETKIEFIDKEIVNKNWNDFLSDEVDFSKCKIGNTGGTSGKPIKLVIPKNRYLWELAHINKIKKRLGWNYNKIALFRNSDIPDNKDFLINPILKQFIFNIYKLDKDYILKVYNLLKRNRIRFIDGYPATIYQFFNLCINQNLDLSFLKGCFFTSEGMTTEQKYFFKKILNIPYVFTYGHSEKLILAGSNLKDYKLKVESTYGYFELVKNDNELIKKENIKGQIIGTTFFNFAMPLIRYKTGDYTSYVEYKSNGSIIDDVEGHHNINKIYKKNMTYVTLTSLNTHGNINETFSGIQFIQNVPGEIIISIIKKSNYTQKSENELFNHYYKAFGQDFNIKFKYVNRLIFQKNGKFLPLINYVKNR